MVNTIIVLNLNLNNIYDFNIFNNFKIYCIYKKRMYKHTRGHFVCFIYLYVSFIIRLLKLNSHLDLNFFESLHLMFSFDSHIIYNLLFSIFFMLLLR